MPCSGRSELVRLLQSPRSAVTFLPQWFSPLATRPGRTELRSASSCQCLLERCTSTIERTGAQSCPDLVSQSLSTPMVGLDQLEGSRRVHLLSAGSLPSPELDSAFDLDRGVVEARPASDWLDIACRVAVDSSAVDPGTAAVADWEIADLAVGTFLAAELVVFAFAGIDLAAEAFRVEVVIQVETIAEAVPGSRLAVDSQDGPASAIALNSVDLASEAFLEIVAVVAPGQTEQVREAFQGIVVVVALDQVG